MISCPFCPKAFKSRDYLKAHMVSHTKEKPYKCLTCSATFGRKTILNTHVKHVHMGKKQVYKTKECPQCSHECPSYMLKRHLRTHSAELPISCFISGCGFKTKYKKTLQQHFRAVHYDEKPFECPTDGCNYKCKRKDRLSDHLKIHSSEKPFSCEVPGCNYAGKFKSSVTKHTKGVHGTEKRFKCSTCDFGTKHRSSFLTHQAIHRNIKHFKCQAPNCDYASHQKNGLERHFDRRHRNKDMLCTAPGCKFRCGSTAVLKLHVGKHELPILRCPGDSCNFRTRFERTLLQHISRRHENVKPALIAGPRVFDLQAGGSADEQDKLHCPFPNCGYQTDFPRHYDRHRITHNEEEKYKHVCTFCFHRFTDSYGLKIHIQRHHGEQPYSCLLCSYTTGCNGQLKSHSRNLHHIYVIPCGKENDSRTCRTCKANCFSYTGLVLHSLSHLRAVVVLQRIDVKVG